MLLCLLALTLHSCRATSLDFDVYRLVQYQVTEDEAGNSDQYSAAMSHTVTNFGSQATQIKSLAFHYSAYYPG